MAPAVTRDIEPTGRRLFQFRGLIPLLAGIAACLSVVAYVVGRLNLLGWYSAAGVPQLLFAGWSYQDVVIRGFLLLDWWIYPSIGVGLLAAVISVQYLSKFVNENAMEYQLEKQKKEWFSSDENALRKRFLREARNSRRGLVAERKQQTDAYLRLQALGSRVKIMQGRIEARKQASAFRIATTPPSRQKLKLIGVSPILLVYGPVLVSIIGALLVIFLFLVPYGIGQREYKDNLEKITTKIRCIKTAAQCDLNINYQ